MGIRFRRRVKILPGVYLNVGKHGVSTSVGVRGAHVTIGKDGTRTTVGAPGTGLSCSHLERGKHSDEPPRVPAAPAERRGPSALALLLIVLVVLFLAQAFIR